jgi:DNA (cytosine-5)-methyltransferase 1
MPYMTHFYGASVGAPVDAPLGTITAAGQHIAEVEAFLVKYYGQGEGQSLRESLHTITTKDRFGLVVIGGEAYQIVDIGMRMLTPRELFRAQGFPEDYIIDRDADGKCYPKSAQVARCGNAVPPPFAEALVRANLPEMCDTEERESA